MFILVIFCSRIAVFSFSLLKDERLVVVAEQKPDSPEDLCNKWMTNVLQVRFLPCFSTFKKSFKKVTYLLQVCDFFVVPSVKCCRIEMLSL